MPDIQAWPRFHQASHTKLLIAGLVKPYSGVFIATFSRSVPAAPLLFWMKFDGAGELPPFTFFWSISNT